MAEMTPDSPRPIPNSYAVQITAGGIGQVGTVTLIGPDGVVVTSSLQGDNTADQFNFWAVQLTKAAQSAVDRDRLASAPREATAQKFERFYRAWLGHHVGNPSVHTLHEFNEASIDMEQTPEVRRIVLGPLVPGRSEAVKVVAMALRNAVAISRSVMHSTPDGSSVVKHETVIVSIESPVNLFTHDSPYERRGAWRILQPIHACPSEFWSCNLGEAAWTRNPSERPVDDITPPRPEKAP